MDSEWGYFVFKVWFFSRVHSGMGGVTIDPQIVFAYAKENKQNKIELLEIVRMIQNSTRERTSE